MASKSRRSFLSHLGVAASAAGATFAAGTAVAHAQTGSDGRWQPARHEKDDWFDHLPGKHRFFFDTSTPDALADAIQFAGNYYTPVAPGAPARARSLAGLMTLGVQFAICDLSTHAIAGLIADASGRTPEAVYKEITANLIDRARLVPAGIVAVNRAQERGYSITGS